MSGVLKPRQLDSEEEEEDLIEYIEVTSRKEKKAILEAEKKGQAPSSPPTSTPIPSLSQQPSSSKTAPASHSNKRKFISDDRERVYPTKQNSVNGRA